jgi:Xaa-Pro aminopeptidase
MATSRAIPPTYRRRLAALRKRIDAAGVDGLLITHDANQRYVTGAVLEDSAVLVTARRVVIVTDSRFDEQASQQAPWADKSLRTDSLPEAVLRAAADLGIRRLGVEEHLPLGQYDLLTRKAARMRVKLTRGLVTAGRMVKDDDEVAAIVRAIRVAERGFLATMRAVRPGVREREIAAELEHQMRKAGGDGAAFEPIVAGGRRGSLPHARASRALVRNCRGLLFDWGAKVDGYCSDLTRVIGVGGLPPIIREIFAVVADAQQAGIAAVRPGAHCRDVDRAAREVIERAGYGPNFGHGLGHGLGLEVHEGPRLGVKSRDVLKAGMVVTVEPGIYLPGVGGVRIEDDVLVTPTGRRVLSRLPKALA